MNKLSTPSSAAKAVSKQSTRVSTAICQLEWRIDHFEKLMKLFKNGQSLASKQFHCDRIPSLVWELHVFPNGKRDEDYGFVSFFLRQVAQQMQSDAFVTEFQIYAIDAHQFRVSVCHDVKDFSDQQGRGKFQVHRDKISTAMHPDGSLHLRCEVEFLPPGIQLLTKHENPWEERSMSEVSVRDSNRQMWESGLFSDCRLLIGSSTFHAHKCILAQNSEVFRSMFTQSATVEAQNGDVVIKDFRPESICAMLEFLYTGSIDSKSMPNVAQEVLVVADKYDLKSLKLHCEDYLASALNVRNICEVAVLADTYNAAQLLEACSLYIAAHYFSVVRTPEWKELKQDRAPLVGQLLEMVMDESLNRDAIGNGIGSLALHDVRKHIRRV